MSALGQKADMCGATRDVRFVPEGTSGLFDHFISAGKKGSRHCDAQRFGGLHIDYGLELCWCLYW
jgi:hypothetical protein